MKPTMMDAFTMLRDALESPPAGTTEADYLAKYAGASADELRIADLALVLRLQEQGRQVGNELLASGRYESQILGPGENAPTPMTAEGGKPISFGFEIHPLGDGRSELRTSVIDAKQHPLIEQLQNESQWLGTHLRHNLRIR